MQASTKTRASRRLRHCKIFEQEQLLPEFCQRVNNFKSLERWSLKQLSDRVILKRVVEPYLLPEFETVVDDSRGFTVFGAYLMRFMKYI